MNISAGMKCAAWLLGCAGSTFVAHAVASPAPLSSAKAPTVFGVLVELAGSCWELTGPAAYEICLRFDSGARKLDVEVLRAGEKIYESSITPTSKGTQLIEKAAQILPSGHRVALSESYIFAPRADGPISRSPVGDRGLATRDCKTWSSWSIQRRDADRFDLQQRVTHDCFRDRDGTNLWTMVRVPEGKRRW